MFSNCLDRMSIDEILEALVDVRLELVAIECKDCKTEFYYNDDTAKYCPKCGSRNVEAVYNRDVELLDFGYRSK